MYHRPLGRSSAHRQALLRNLVTSLIQHETITTTWPKAKEAQRLAEKLITLCKRNTNATRVKAEAILYDPHKHMSKLFGELRERYADRPGGYTRVLRAEPQKDDQAESAILSLVDGPKDMRFAMTAKALVRQREEGLNMHELTATNIRKVTRFRRNGEQDLETEVHRLEAEKERVEMEENQRFEDKGTQFEWVPRTFSKKDRGGPGRLKKQTTNWEDDLG